MTDSVKQEAELSLQSPQQRRYWEGNLKGYGWRSGLKCEGGSPGHEQGREAATSPQLSNVRSRSGCPSQGSVKECFAIPSLCLITMQRKHFSFHSQNPAGLSRWLSTPARAAYPPRHRDKQRPGTERKSVAEQQCPPTPLSGMHTQKPVELSPQRPPATEQ